MSIRLATKADLLQILAIYAPYVENTTFSFEYEPPTPAEFENRFSHITAQFPWLVWEENGEILGYAYASAPFSRAAYRWCAEPSIYLAPHARRKGIGKALYAALEELLRLQGYRTAYAIITSGNPDSIAFHKAMGYSYLAEFPDCGFKHGAWCGITWMEKLLNPVEMPSNFPKPYFSIVKDNKILQEILAKISLS